MTDIPLEQEAQQLLALSEEDLYLLLVSRTGTGDLYTKDSLVARGKAVFVETFKQHRDLICQTYGQQQSQAGSIVDLVVILASAFANNPAFSHVPILPVVAIAVKIGLEQLCREQA